MGLSGVSVLDSGIKIGPDVVWVGMELGQMAREEIGPHYTTF